MRRFLVLTTAVILMAAALLGVGTARAETEEQAEWTVLFYLCGSDLESKYGYASENLREIADCHVPRNEMGSIIRTYGDDASDEADPGRVNVLIETGGCRQWHAQDLGMNILPRRLNRWRYAPGAGDEPGSFILLEDRAPANMADKDTLIYMFLLPFS